MLLQFTVIMSDLHFKFSVMPKRIVWNSLPTENWQKIYYLGFFFVRGYTYALTSGLQCFFPLTYRIQNMAMSIYGGAKAMQRVLREPDLASSPWMQRQCCSCGYTYPLIMSNSSKPEKIKEIMASCYNFIIPPAGLPKCTTVAFPPCEAGDMGKYKCTLKYVATTTCVFETI